MLELLKYMILLFFTVFSIKICVLKRYDENQYSLHRAVAIGLCQIVLKCLAYFWQYGFWFRLLWAVRHYPSLSMQILPETDFFLLNVIKFCRFFWIPHQEYSLRTTQQSANSYTAFSLTCMRSVHGSWVADWLYRAIVSIVARGSIRSRLGSWSVFTAIVCVSIVAIVARSLNAPLLSWCTPVWLWLQIEIWIIREMQCLLIFFTEF